MKFGERVTVHPSTLERLGRESLVLIKPEEPEPEEVRRRRSALDALSPTLREYVEDYCAERNIPLSRVKVLSPTSVELP